MAIGNINVEILMIMTYSIILSAAKKKMTDNETWRKWPIVSILKEIVIMKKRDNENGGSNGNIKYDVSR